MAWHRLGHLYTPDGSQSWARSHAALPTPLHLHGDVFRLYFSARDDEKRSHLGWVDVAVSSQPTVIAAANAPLLSPGETGAFDDSGVSIGCVTRDGETLRLYYMGWNLGVRSPWRNAIGLATATTADGPFTRFSAGPIVDRSPEDPYTLSYPCVLRDGSMWRMWYGSNLSAALGHADMSHTVKHAQSSDGVRWDRDGAAVITFASSDEYAIARPSVLQTPHGYLMAYACRGARYRIEMSASPDGLLWDRLDGAGLAASGEGWDGDMTCYPALFMHEGRLWMAYNGNDYGATGVGLAVWDGRLPDAAT